LRVAVPRARAAVISVLAMLLVLGLVPPAPAVGHEPDGIDRFMEAVGQVESGGRYNAHNRSSGAYGKYQIIPSSWRGWARLYLGDANAPRTPQNQEIVARAKMTALYRWLGDWRRVAHWWLTGSSRTESLWSTTGRRYVAKVMKAYREGPAAPAAPAPDEPIVASDRRSYQEANSAIVYTGAWREAPYPAYAGRNARWTNETGATATFMFTGRTVAWFGPSGPTRGRANVFVDGEAAGSVNLYALRFRPKTQIFAMTFAEPGPHTLLIEVVATKGRPTVAIDQFVVTE
jgi:hypothetical protein